MADTDQDKKPAWVPMSKELAKSLPIDRPFTEVEAVFSLQLDYNKGNPVTVSGYANRWQWHRDKVRRLLNECNLEISYPLDTRHIQKQKGELTVPTDHPTETRQIKFINFKRLQSTSDRNPTDRPTLLKELQKNKNTEKKKTREKDPRVTVFIEWFKKKFKMKFNQDYLISNHAEVGSQVKKLLSLPLSWEDLQFISIEFLLDEDPFLEKTGHNIGQLLSRIGKNVYSRYLDRNFREDNAHHTIEEPPPPGKRQSGSLFGSTEER